MLTSNYLRPALWPLLTEPFRRAGPLPDTTEDESIRSFISRRFSPLVADRLVSAVVSGIYAGDIGELSARACFGRLWHAERRYGSIIRGLSKASKEPMDPDLLALRETLLSSESTPLPIREAVNASVYAFRGGMQTLTDTLADTLAQRWPDRYTLRLNTPVQSLTFNDHTATASDICITGHNGY
jgi:oxygen-dependent protoporphyrinogen oxidase